MRRVDLVGAFHRDGRGKMLHLIAPQGKAKLHQKKLIVFEAAFCLREFFLIGRIVDPCKGICASDKLGHWCEIPADRIRL